MTQELYWLFGGVGTCLSAGFVAYVSIVRKLEQQNAQASVIKAGIDRIASDLESEKKVRVERHSDFEARIRQLERKGIR